ncbi:MAG TPA: gamma-glutamyltransferase [Woeseiaceae bacterium]|nr:gamma-glutamyltransferase [Woeseiaceae bacterium]
MKRIPILVVILALCGCSPGPNAPSGSAASDVQPAASTSWPHGGMVSAANPYAVQAAAEVLARGGHAVDAAIAAHAVLGLVEPESSGLGGSGFMLVYDAGDAMPVVFDGRETAPAGAAPDMFMRDGQPMGFREAWQTGLAVGVPGAVAMYEAAHREYGRLPWAELFAPAIRLAENGFEITPKLHDWLVRLAPMVSTANSPDAYAYFYPDGEPLAAGAMQRNPPYARMLERIAADGAAALYQGEVAAAIAARVRREPMPGSMTAADINDYTVVKRAAVCGGFRGGRICSAPPPSSGLAQIMIANLYDLLDPDDASRPQDIRAFVDAQRLAYADRDRYVADPAYADVPTEALIAPAYLAARAADRFDPDEKATPGEPRAGARGAAAAGASAEQPGTSHLSIIDTDGNAVSMTASVGAPFGSLRMTHGFLLNNEMSDFAMAPTEMGVPVVNAVAPGKRPRSSMSPTMVFDAAGELSMVTGSPGGNSIVAYVAKSIVAALDWGFSAQQAADFPNIIARGDTVRVENTDATGQAIADALAAEGYDVKESAGENSGLHLIVVHPDRLDGAADKRREGTVAHVGP